MGKGNENIHTPASVQDLDDFFSDIQDCIEDAVQELKQSKQTQLDLIQNPGRSIKLFRLFANLKQKDLALKLGVTQNYLSSVEHGKREPNLRFLRKFIAEV